MAIDVLQDVLDTIRLQGLITGIHTFTTDNKYNRTHAKRKLFNSVEPSEDNPPFFAVMLCCCVSPHNQVWRELLYRAAASFDGN